MTITQRRRIVEIFRGLPSILVLSFVTAVTTIVLAMILSLVIGGENRRLQQQAVTNAQEIVDHAAVSRCEMAYVVEILKEIGQQAEGLDLSAYPVINTEGLDCESILKDPFVPGRNLYPYYTTETSAP